jgi:hypothetical protein
MDRTGLPSTPSSTAVPLDRQGQPLLEQMTGEVSNDENPINQRVVRRPHH